MRTYVLCHGCQHRSLTEQRYYDMNIECQNSSSMSQGLNNFFSIDELRGINKYRCENCKKLNNAQKGFSLVSLPKILTFQFKRFTNSLRKIGKPINYPKKFNMYNYMAQKQMIDEESCIYQLYGITVHAGSSSYSGHYYSFVKSNNNWYQMNDSNVSQCSQDRAMAQQAYILFYKRIKQHISIHKDNSESCEKTTSKLRKNSNSESDKILNHSLFNKQIQDITQKKLMNNEKSTTSRNNPKQTLSTSKNNERTISQQKPEKKQERGKSQSSLMQSQRKISMSIEKLKNQYSAIAKQNKLIEHKTVKNGNDVHKDQQKPNGNKSKSKSKNKSKKPKIQDAQDFSDECQAPSKLVRRRSKEEAFNSMPLQEIILQYSAKLLELQVKLPRNGIGHRALRSMNIIRRTEIAMKKKKLG